MPDFERMARRQRLLADFGDFTMRSQDLDEVLTQACRLVSEVLGTEHAKVLEIDGSGRSLLLRAGVGWPAGLVGTLRLEMRDHSSETYSIKAGKPVITQDIAQEDRFEVPAFLKDAGVVALVNVPIFLPGGRAYGLLQVDSRERRDFGEGDTEFLRTYATILGPVIDRLHKIRRLEASQERFRLVVENALDYAIFISDEEDRITDWFPGAEAVFGWTAEEAVGQAASIIFTPEDRANRVDEEEAETACARSVAPDRRWHLRKDGARVFIDGTNTALRDEGGTVRGFLKIGQDVTERRRTEEALRESEARLRAVLEQAPLAIAFTGTHGDIQFRNAMFDKLWGRPAQDTTAHTYSDVYEGYHLDGRPVASKEWPGARAVLNGEVVEGEMLEIVQASGRHLTCWFAASAIRNEAGHITGGVVLFRDASEERRAQEVLARSREELETQVAKRTAELMTAEENLRQAQKMEAVGQLTGGIAHDFNNMLQGVTGGLGMAQRRFAQGRNDEALRYLDTVQQAAERAAGLTRRLLAFARRRPSEPKPIDTDRLVVGLADLIRRTVGTGIALELRLRDGAGSVLCDPNEMESALLNLCINARDAMPEDGRLTISTEDLFLSATDAQDEGVASGLYVALCVADTGTGMPPEVIERVFEPFFTTKPLGQGTGLGLSQVWSFVRQSGGLVRIESAPGQGTTVRLLLPLHQIADAAEQSEAVSAGPEEHGEAGMVLLVDDEEAARQPAADRLRELGHTVLEAGDGPEALRILATIRPDLLVTDVGLPNGINGRQLAEAAREAIPGLPVLFISGYAGTSLPPGIDVIDKPFELDALVRRVRGALNIAQRAATVSGKPDA